MIRAAIFLAALLLSPFGAMAQDVHSLTADGKCPPALTSFMGVTDGKLWTVRQCRPPAAEIKNLVWWNRYYTINDLKAIPAGAGAVVEAYRAGDKRKVIDLGEKLIDRPLTDPTFAKAYAAAQAAAVLSAIPVYASTANGAACDCRTKMLIVNNVRTCPLASVPDGANVNCQGR